MDANGMIAYYSVPFDPSAYPVPGQYPFPGGFPPGAMPFPTPFPATPTSSGMQFPDTTVKSGSEFGDTPPSSGGSNQPKRKFKSPEEEKRYKIKRARNNEAAKKSRKSRKEKEHGLMEENTILKGKIEELTVQYTHLLNMKDREIAQLKAALQSASFQSNSENVDPVGFTESKMVFQMFGNSMNQNSQ